jgi:hypothetical protein
MMAAEGIGKGVQSGRKFLSFSSEEEWKGILPKVLNMSVKKYPAQKTNHATNRNAINRITICGTPSPSPLPHLGGEGKREGTPKILGRGGTHFPSPVPGGRMSSRRIAGRAIKAVNFVSMASPKAEPAKNRFLQQG